MYLIINLYPLETCTSEEKKINWKRKLPSNTTAINFLNISSEVAKELSYYTD